VKIFWQLYFANPAIFIGQAITNFGTVGSIFPTSAPLRRRVVEISLEGKTSIETVVIHGVGCGEFVYELLRQSHERGIRVGRIIAMDVNETFVDRTRALLPIILKRFPNESEVTLETMDAMDTPAYLARSGVNKANVIIGTIPYSMLQSSEAWAKMYKESTDKFVYYTYEPYFKPPKHLRATEEMLEALQTHFGKVEEGARVRLNLPPAKVIVASNTPG